MKVKLYVEATIHTCACGLAAAALFSSVVTAAYGYSLVYQAIDFALYPEHEEAHIQNLINENAYSDLWDAGAID